MGSLGPKADFYRALAREEWGPIRRRSSVRQAMFWAIGGAALMLGGVFGIAITGEAIAVFVVGLIAVSSAWHQWRDYRPLFQAWRSIGDITLVGPPTELRAGEVGVVRVRVAPRCDGELSSVSLTFAWRDSRSGPAGTAWAVDAVIADAALVRGVSREIAVKVALPPGVPPSRFDVGWTRQWQCSARVELTDGRVWERVYPVFVLPDMTTAPM